jgi:hypothetical protein
MVETLVKDNPSMPYKTFVALNEAKTRMEKTRGIIISFAKQYGTGKFKAKFNKDSKNL